MAKIWFNRVYTRAVTFEDVPEKYRDKVFDIAMGWVADERMTVEEFKELFGEGTDE